VRRRKQHEQVYWPAFADLLTVLVVVLLTAVATANRPSPPVVPPSPQPPALPKTQTEFENALLGVRQRCILKDLRQSTPFPIRSGGLSAIEIPICSVAENGDRTGCIDAMRVTTAALASANLIPRIERERLVVFVSMSLRATGGRHSPIASRLGDELALCVDLLRMSRSGALARVTMNPEQYIETGPAARPGEMVLAMRLGLPEADRLSINAMWGNSWDALQQLLVRSQECLGQTE